ncbi:MAG: radical SAM protein, partial [Sulfolobaceae archaeon]|nr:radical SAM protein [Sulfolobales archaeon]
ELLDRLTDSFLKLWRDVREGREDIRRLEVPKYSLLDYLADLMDSWVERCTFCRWGCKVNRKVRAGACRLNVESRVASYFHHRGEELVFRGTEGSGTIFFTSCNMRCAFCQNGDISKDKDNGVPLSPKRLAGAMRVLASEGVHNVNLVGGEPTVHLHTIIKAIRELAYGNEVVDEVTLLPKADYPYFYTRKRRVYGNEVSVPMLWNSNFFMSEEAMKVLRLVIDVWLPDFKFGNNRCALRLSRTPWYVETVTANLSRIYSWGEEAVIRHLVMPNHVEDDTVPVLEWIAKNVPNYWVNLMDQYRPEYAADPFSPLFDPKYSDIARYPTREEIETAYSYARKLGIKFELTTFY